MMVDGMEFNVESTEELAAMANLCHVSDEEPGFQRLRAGRGFTYRDAKGQTVKDKALRKRFEALVIPPAWTHVWICALPDGHIQATGRDDKGRKQYIYHPRWAKVRDEVKFNQLVAFGEALPPLREQVEEDLRGRGLTRPKVIALVVRLLDETHLRIGNMAYATANRSYGLTTLHTEHTVVNGSQVTFSFPGKGGKQQKVTMRSRRLARLVRKCQELPGQMLFQYMAEDGSYQILTSSDVNAYLHENMGQPFTAKVFRTWGATVTVTDCLATLPPPASETEGQKNIVAAIKQAAAALGNTPTVCRQYYVHPAILTAYMSGELAAAAPDPENRTTPPTEFGLSPIETLVLTLLHS